jgi:hypothetical protein
MVNKIITGISQALDSEFNSTDKDYEIYTESIEQGFDEPCFSVLKLISSESQLVGNRYEFMSSWDIQYFPSNEPDDDGIVRKNEECNNVAGILSSIMKLITIDSKLTRGTKMRNEIIDSVLHFYVDYNFIAKYEITDSTEKMGTLSISINIKGGN